MAPALKDIGRINELLGASPLSMSPLWIRSADKITIQAIYAFVGSLSERGQRDQAETVIDIALGEVRAAVERGEFAAPAMLAYKPPLEIRLTVSEMRNGLRYAQHPKASAILFALEMRFDIAGVEHLTWTQVARMENLAALTTTAQKCLLACPQQRRFKYVFWQHDGDGRLLQLCGLDQTVGDAFGMPWPELEIAYSNLMGTKDVTDHKGADLLLRS